MIEIDRGHPKTYRVYVSPVCAVVSGNALPLAKTLSFPRQFLVFFSVIV